MSIRRSYMAIVVVLCAMAYGRPCAAGEDIRARADKVSGQVKSKGRELVVLEGNVSIVHGRTEIFGDRAVYDKEAGSLTVTGAVRLSHEGVRIEAQELFYQRQTKEGRFLGQVKLERDEEEDAEGGAAKEAFSLTSEELIFAAEKKNFTSRGEAAMTHKDFTATAMEIAYDDEHQELILTGSPTLNHRDEVVKGEKIRISVEDDRIEILQAEITFLVGEEEAAEEGTAEEAPAPGGEEMETDQSEPAAGETAGPQTETGAVSSVDGGDEPPGT